MRLDELAGVKKYRTKSFDDWLIEFRKSGGEAYWGKYATVLLHPKWDYVYKLFARDDFYLRFIRWAARNPHPCLPRVLEKPRRMIPFYYRHRSDNRLYVVKIEKLEPSELKRDDELFHEMESMSPQWFAILDDPEVEKAAYLYEYSWFREKVQRWRDRFTADPKLRELCEFYFNTFMQSGLPGWHDISASNIMHRPSDGSYVLTDPLWAGETPLQVHDRMMRAEIDYDEPPESEYVEGGKLWKKPKKRKPRPFGGFGDDDDIPF